jgi:hypothetical protein
MEGQFTIVIIPAVLSGKIKAERAARITPSCHKKGQLNWGAFPEN